MVGTKTPTLNDAATRGQLLDAVLKLLDVNQSIFEIAVEENLSKRMKLLDKYKDSQAEVFAFVREVLHGE